MRIVQRFRWLAFGTTLALAASSLFIACGTQDRASMGDGWGIPPGTSDACGHPNPGCTCDSMGAVADCGKVEQTVGSFVMCSMGTTTCDGKQWGTCQGTTVVAKSKSFTSGGGLHVSALGAQGACVGNPCDPYCNAYVDDPCGLDASGLSSSPDCGLRVGASGANLCYCDQPSGGSATLYANLPAADKGNPASCVSGASDNCEHDYHCSATDGGSGACTPYGIAGYNASCVSAPDFTLGMGCSSGTTYEMEVCNRGLVSAVSGHLYVAVSQSSPTGTAGTCPFPTGPAVPAASAKDGYCNVDLSATPIVPGQCISIDLTNTATCKSTTGAALDLTGGARFFVVNPSTTVLPTSIVTGYAPLAECDSCNNYTAENPGLPAASACANEICGTACGGFEAGAGDGGGGGSGCHTYVTGKVYDPGANIPLPSIAVYQPKVALTAFSAGVSCDTCTSVLPTTANIASSTYSDATGSFALEVTATTGIPVVFQTGRWRRQITIGTDTPALTACTTNNITVAADCVYPGANCKTRLPQTHAEGDIPLIAMVTGSREPFECSVAQFMGGTSEMGVGGSYRIQLLQDTGADTVANPATYGSGTAASVTGPPTANGTGWGTTAMSGSTETVAGMGTHVVSGNKPSVSNAVANVVTVTGLSGASLTAADVGGTITFSGAATGANNGTWTIASVLSSTSLTITHAGGTSDGNNNHSGFTWSIFGPVGPFTAAYVGGTLDLENGDSKNRGTFPIVSVLSATSVTITNAQGVVPDGKNYQSSVTWAAKGTGSVAVSGLTGRTAADVGRTITLSNTSSGGNAGSFTIVTVPSATSVTISNASAVTDGNNGSIHWSVSDPSGSSIPSVTNLWANPNQYDAVILPCGGVSSAAATLSGAGQTAMYSYLKAGGKIFANHWSEFGLIVPSTSVDSNGSPGHGVAPFSTTSTFSSTIANPSNTAYLGKVAPGGSATTPQQNFQTWLTTFGAYAGGGVSTPQPVVTEALNPSATGFEWLRGADTSGSSDWVSHPSGNFNLVYSFDTSDAGVVPTLLGDGGAGSGCGRMISSNMHVDTARSGSGTSAGTFPTECNLGALGGSPVTGGFLSPNEAAFEYLMFVLSSCAVGGAPIAQSSPPPPPAPPALPPGISYTRDFHAVCPNSTLPVWQLFNWQAVVPAGTSIDFTAQVAPDLAGAPGSYAPSTPFSIGSATSSTTAWTTQQYAQPPLTAGPAACTLDQHLTGGNGCPGPGNSSSQEWLRITMTFNTAGALSPTLTNWEQLFDCVPAK
jgi:hypothetical protein